jgi:hypothetical protein
MFLESSLNVSRMPLQVPIRDLWNGPILSRAAVFILAAAGKLVTGAFAKPYTHHEVRLY